jgi:hypothetical protein
MMAPKTMAPPAPSPQRALAKIKLRIDGEIAHHNVPSAKARREKIKGGRRPMVSDRRPNIGWKAVDVKRKDVESHDAELEDLKYEVIAG